MNRPLDSICILCRIRLLSRRCTSKASQQSSRQLHLSLASKAQRSTFQKTRPTLRQSCIQSQKRPFTTKDSTSKDPTAQETSHEPLDAATEEALTTDHPPETDENRDVFQVARSYLGPEAIAIHARKRFGDRLPEGALKQEEYESYERMFGTPLPWKEQDEDAQYSGESETAEYDRQVLLRDGMDGASEEVHMEPEYFEEAVDNIHQLASENAPHPSSSSQVNDGAKLNLLPQLYSDPRMSTEETNGNRLNEVETEMDPEYEPDTAEHLRAHPFTLSSRSGTSPSTLSIPKPAMANPVSIMLSNVNNKHLDETAERVFGGPGLPYSSSTPLNARNKTQKPIPLSPLQSQMVSMEADAYMAAVMPGSYASIMSILVEIRKQMGSGWVEDLFNKEGGPGILDAGAGGAAVLAWQEMLRAEWARIQDTSSSSKAQQPEASKTSSPSTLTAQLGKATVVASSSPMRDRASLLLLNTTFLPRLPDYIHVSHDPDNPNVDKRKQFDIIVAPHSLWSIQEDYQRKMHIQNLWAMLKPKGGVMIFLEKGVPRGFEVIAGARQYILDELFTPSNADSARSLDSEENVAPLETDQSSEQAVTRKGIPRSPGKIIAPCTTHAKCPMLRHPGHTPHRKDFCHFQQRYHRPSYMQRMLGAKSRDHEDVKFSYVAIQRGVTREGRDSLNSKKATDRAFAGYDLLDADLAVAAQSHSSLESSVTASSRGDSAGNPSQFEQEMDPNEEEVLTTPPPTAQPPQRELLPRIIQTPLKRQGHVMLDVCTPAGTFERWTVPKSYGKQAYRDARKASWGDLWPLGGKNRVPRGLRIGDALRLKKEVETEETNGDDGPTKIKVKGRVKPKSQKREERKAARKAMAPRVK